MFYLALFSLQVGLVGQGGDDVHRLPVFILGDGIAVHVVPVGSALACIVVVPAIAAFSLLVGAVAQALDERAEPFLVVGMDVGITYLDAHVIAEDGLSVQIEHAVLLQVETHHVVAADVKSHHHGLLLVKHILRIHPQSLNFSISHFLSITVAEQGMDTHTLVPFL